VEDANKQGMAHEVNHPVTHVTQGHMEATTDAAAPEETGPEKVQMVHGPCHTIVLPFMQILTTSICVAPSRSVGVSGRLILPPFLNVPHRRWLTMRTRRCGRRVGR
jgi:hypothetical protein